MKTRRKRYQAECPKCKALKKMAVVGSSDNEQYIWLRCSCCHLTFLFPVTWFDNTVMVRAPREEFDLAAENMRTVVEYSLHKRFNLGQLIYHKRFNDVGQVIAKEQTGDNTRIVVQFKHCGEKILVEGLSPA